MMVLFDETSRRTKDFAQQTGLKCKKGCGACCSTPEIETTVAEVLPLAVYLWSQGLALAKLDNIRSSSTPNTCILYEADPINKTQGRCSAYAYRPGLCRLFGFTTRTDKHGKPVLMTCKVIKENQSQECERTQEKLEKGLKAPSLAEHTFSVMNIDPVYGQKLFPINQAIRQAIEKVGYSIQQMK